MLLFIFYFALLVLSAKAVSLHSQTGEHGLLVSRQANSSVAPTYYPSLEACEEYSQQFKAVKNQCTYPHCGCTIPNYLDYQGGLLVCANSSTPSGMAAVQFLLDAEVNQCQNSGFNTSFVRVGLPPAAEAMVDQYYSESSQIRQEQKAFLALQIAGGHVGLTIVLLFALFSRKVQRDPTFLNFCITWIASSIIYSLLLYHGTKGNTIENTLGAVPVDTCLAQAVLVSGAQVMTAGSTTALVIQLWLRLRFAISGNVTKGSQQKSWITYSLLAMPYALFWAFAIPAIFVGQVQITVAGATFQRVVPTNFYCSVISLDSFFEATYGVTLALLLITVVFDVLVIRALFQHWKAFRHFETKSAVSLSILLRVVAFSIYRVITLVALGSVIRKPPQISTSGSGVTLAVVFGVPVWVDMLQAATPLVAFLVLGMNRDMFFFWRKSPRADNTPSSSVQSISGSSQSMHSHSLHDDEALLYHPPNRI